MPAVAWHSADLDAGRQIPQQILFNVTLSHSRVGFLVFFRAASCDFVDRFSLAQIGTLHEITRSSMNGVRS